MKNSLEGFRGRFEPGKESVNLKIGTEIIKPEEQKVKRSKKRKQILKELCDTIRQKPVYASWVSQKENKDKKRYLK